MLGRQQSGSDEAGPDERDDSGETNTAGESLPRIAGYELQRQIGRGGSATVYLAREIKHDRLVALKVLHPALAASLQAERFLREISIIAKLSHPNILPLLDSGSVGGQLYYVTPYVEGESLRRRLERERQLPADTAARLAVEVAGALDYAHRQGLVHRDVKPENILLADGHALVADFGIARALSLAGDDRLTAFGIVVGTPRYMSPEQAEGKKLDGRADVYSLGCVLFELLTGNAPFDGETPLDIVAQHLSAPIPSLRNVRPRVPPAIAQACYAALAKRSDERFATAADFASALTLSPSVWWPRLPAHWRPGRRSLVTAAAISTVFVSVVVAQRTRTTPEVLPWHLRVLAGAGLTRISLDTNRLIVVPGDSASARAGTDAGVMLRAALRKWRELSVEDESRVTEEMSPGTGSQRQRVQRAAITLGAGRFIRYSLTPGDDSMTLAASLHDTRTNSQLTIREVHFPINQRLTMRSVQQLTDGLLFRTGVPVERTAGSDGTNSLVARSLYFQGHQALANGNFVLAESLFVAATQSDERYPQAIVWLANLRSWVEASDLPWRQLPARAVDRRVALSPNDSILLDALTALAARNFGDACKGWMSLTKLAPNDFASWYGLGNCLRRDRTVVRAPDLPNGWRFQSSRHSSVLAYEQAFQLRPAVLRGFSGRLGELQTLMFTGGSTVLTGRATDPDARSFTGYPVWQGDTLAILALSGLSIELGPGSDAFAEAIQGQRLRFRDVAALWKSEFPRSADAIEALAIAMEMLGNPAALDTLQRARSLAVDPEDRLRIAVDEVLMRLKFSVPNDRAGLRRVRLLSDSLLRAHPPEQNRAPRLLGALAGITGRADLAVAYARREGWDTSLPPALARTAPSIIAFAAFGGPDDSLQALETALTDAIKGLPPSERARAQSEWLNRATVLAFPQSRLRSRADSSEMAILAHVISRALTYDTAGVARALAQLSSARRWLRPADVMMDGLLPEAAALVAIGERDAAAIKLDATLRALRFTAAQDLAYTYRTAPLVRAMMLRAEIALAAGDDAALATWAGAAAELWSGADAPLLDAVRRMRSMSR